MMMLCTFSWACCGTNFNLFCSMFGQKKVKLVGGLVFAAHPKPIIPQNRSFLQLLPPIFLGGAEKFQTKNNGETSTSNQNLCEIPLNPGWLIGVVINLIMTLYNPSLTVKDETYHHIYIYTYIYNKSQGFCSMITPKTSLWNKITVLGFTKRIQVTLNNHFLMIVVTWMMNQIFT